jgi:PAS domain S-box-containing protein
VKEVYLKTVRGRRSEALYTPMISPSGHRSSSDDIAAALAGVVVAIGGAVLVGWAFELAWLKNVVAGLPAMKANTALCFILSGSAVLLSAPRLRAGRAAAWLRRALLGGVALIAGLTLLENAGVDLWIDQLLFEDRDAPAGMPPGRASAATAGSFLLFCAAMALPRQAPGPIFAALTTLGLLIAFSSLMGYAYKVPELYQPTAYAWMALHTSAAFATLFVSAALTRPQVGWVALLRSRAAGSTTTSWVVPAVILLPPLLGWLTIRGEAGGHFEIHTGMVFFAVATVVLLTGLLWLGGVRGNRLHEALRNRERLSHAIVDGAFDAFVLMDERGVIRDWNSQSERIFGWRRDEAVGRTVRETLVPAAHRDAHRDGLAHFLATGEGPLLRRSIEVAAQRRDGSEFPAELIIVPIRHEGRWLFSGFLRDLTERKQAEHELRQSQKMQAVGQLTGGLAHDFNNLLTVIIGGLEIVMDRVHGETRTTAESVMRAAERGAALTHRLLAFARRQPLRHEKLDLNAVMLGMQEMLRRTLGETIDLQLRLEPRMAPAVADKAQLENAVLNLAINARDAMAAGGRLIIATANTTLDEGYAALNPEATPGDYAMLSVSDTGAGMTPEVLERVFEPFFTTKETGKGTGLGLSMIYGFVKQSGGHVKIYSEPGLGTTVRLYLPRAEDGTQKLADDPSAVERPGRGEVVLVAEDNEEVRRAAVAHLQGLGYRTIEAEDGRRALAIIESPAPIDLLFTDVVMAGGMSGVALARKARRLRPHLRVLFTSGFGETDQHDGDLEESQIIRKPYRRIELARRLRDLFSGTASSGRPVEVDEAD